MFLEEEVSRLALCLWEDKADSSRPLERKDELERRVERVRIIALRELLGRGGWVGEKNRVR